MRAATSPVWGEVNREEGQCQGPNPSLWPLSSGAVVEPQGRQLYQHDLRLRVVSFTQAPLNGHQSRLCTSNKHREKQQTLNNYRPRGAAVWGCKWSSGWTEKMPQMQAAPNGTRADSWNILASVPKKSKIIKH